MLYGVKFNGKILGAVQLAQKEVLKAAVTMAQAIGGPARGLEICACEVKEVPLAKADAAYKEMKVKEKTEARAAEKRFRQMLKEGRKAVRGMAYAGPDGKVRIHE